MLFLGGFTTLGLWIVGIPLALSFSVIAGLFKATNCSCLVLGPQSGRCPRRSAHYRWAAGSSSACRRYYLFSSHARAVGVCRRFD